MVQHESDARHQLDRIQNGVKNYDPADRRFAEDGKNQTDRTGAGHYRHELLLKDVLADLQPNVKVVKSYWRIGHLSPEDCDPGLVKQVFVNLISNAVKYTRRREIAVIEVGQVEEEGASVIFIRDNGAGFEQRYADKIISGLPAPSRADDFGAPA